MASLDTASSIAQIASFVAPAVIGVYAIWRRIDKRQTESHIAAVRIGDRLENMQKQLDVQFGGNGGGLREAVNTIKDDMKVMDLKVDKATADIASLAGKFEQHVREN
jgi:hypothetical protein